MIKNFADWHIQKESIDSSTRVTPLRFKEREVWWLSLGHNVGCEENGKNSDFSRPVLVLRKFNSDMFWGIPLTSKFHSDDRYHQAINISGTSIINIALTSQMRTFDTKRMIRKMGMIGDQEFFVIKDKVKRLI